MDALRDLAKALGIDSTWSQDLHMGDVVEKRIRRALARRGGE